MELNDILNAFNEKPELKKAFVNHLNESKENQKIIQPVIDPIVSNIHGMYEADMLEVTGVEKPANEQGYKFYKRYLKDEISKIQGLDTENKELKNNLENGLKGSNAEWQDKIEKLKNEHAKALEEESKKLTEFEYQRKLDLVFNGLKNEYSKLNIKEDIKSFVDKDADYKLMEIAKNSNVNPDGTITFNKDGEIWRDESYKVLTSSEIIQNLYSDVIDNGNNQNGGGSRQQAAANGNGKTGVVINMATVSSKVDIYNQIEDAYKADGKQVGTKEFQDDYREAVDTYGADLPDGF